ncbi:unnamed protein product, partial [Scytosiphon promiscuus]
LFCSTRPAKVGLTRRRQLLYCRVTSVYVVQRPRQRISPTQQSRQLSGAGIFFRRPSKIVTRDQCVSALFLRLCISGDFIDLHFGCRLHPKKFCIAGVCHPFLKSIIYQTVIFTLYR